MVNKKSKCVYIITIIPIKKNVFNTSLYIHKPKENVI